MRVMRYWGVNEEAIDLNHEAMTRTGITCNENLVICTTQLAGGASLKMLIDFEVMLSIFKFSGMWEIAEFWLVFVNTFPWINQFYFLTGAITGS